MQCPPTPGPGVKRMNPNGFVAAASMTSQTSRPIRSHSSASWLTNAMFTFRKTFSRSLASSAASGEDSSMTLSLIRPSSAAARCVAAGVVAPTSRGTPFEALAGSPGLTRSGANARSKSWPALSPRALELLAERPGRRPGKGRRLEDDELAGAELLADRARRPTGRGPRSGSFERVIGVGTQTKMTSASARWRLRRLDDAEAGRRGRPGGDRP